MPNIPKPDAATLAVLAAAGYPDPGAPKGAETKPKPGLIEEAFSALVTATSGNPLGAGIEALQGATSLSDAQETKGSISQYLIAGGGSQHSDTAPMNAILSALNRLAGFKSRL